MTAFSRLNRRLFVACTTLFCLSYGAMTASAEEVLSFDSWHYAAVAYSTSTGEYGYSYHQPSLGVAKSEALSMCPAEDAEIVGWVQGGFLILAVGEDLSYGVGWEYGDGSYSRDASDRARANCESFGTRVKKMVCLCSGDYAPRIVEMGN